MSCVILNCSKTDYCFWLLPFSVFWHFLHVLWLLLVQQAIVKINVTMYNVNDAAQSWLAGWLVVGFSFSFVTCTTIN